MYIYYIHSNYILGILLIKIIITISVKSLLNHCKILLVLTSRKQILQAFNL